MPAFEQVAAQPQCDIGLPPYDRWLTPDGEVVALFYRTKGSFIVRFPRKADFELHTDAGMVICTPTTEVPPQVVTDLFYNQVMPLHQNYVGELVLHASAIAGSTGAIGFLGQSGRGKSTLAASFASCGHPFLTDDGLMLKRIDASYLAMPNRPYLRIRYDGEDGILGRTTAAATGDREGKTLLDAGPSLPFQDQPIPLAALYFLGPGTSESVKIARIPSALGLSELLKHSFILDVQDRARLSAHFDRLAQLANSMNCYTLDYPRHYEALPEVMAAVHGHVQSGDPES